MLRRVWVLFLPLTLFWITACGLIQGGDALTDSTAIETPNAQIDPTPQPQLTPEPIIPAPVTDTTQILRVWVPPELAVESDELGTAVLREQIDNYALTQADLEIVFETKLVSGQGGILSYLRTGRNIAPSVLPDLIAIPAEQLDTVSRDELIVPLNDLIDPTLIDDLYPAAQSFAVSNELILGYPFALTNLTHFVVNTTQVTETISNDWDTLILSEDVNLSIAFGGPQGGLLVLQLYLASGGTLMNEAGQQTVQPEILVLVLDQLQSAVEENRLNLSTSQSALPEELWDAYFADRTNVILTNSEQYQIQSDLTDTAVYPVSGAAASLQPIVRGWAWAISTPNSNQQALAVGLLNHLTAVDSVDIWSRSSQILPANPNVLGPRVTESEYFQFIQGELFNAQPMPSQATNEMISLFQNAALQVISGDASPQAAATEVANNFQE